MVYRDSTGKGGLIRDCKREYWRRPSMGRGSYLVKIWAYYSWRHRQAVKYCGDENGGKESRRKVEGNYF
jgi:hypothetical protein